MPAKSPNLQPRVPDIPSPESTTDRPVDSDPPGRTETRSSPFVHASATLPVFLLLLILGPVAGYLAYRSAADLELREALVEFDEQLLVQVAHVRENTLAIVEALHSLKAFFNASEHVTRTGFATFAENVRERLPVVLAVEWIPRVAADQRAAHESAARNSGLPGYVLREMGGDQAVRSAGSREVYYPVFYVEPIGSNKSALGYDLGSERVRRDTLRRAAETGRVALSDPVSLVQEDDACPAVLAVLSVKTGPEDPLGFVLLAFRIDDLARHSLLGDPGEKPSWMEVSLFDVDVDSRPQVLFESAGFRGDYEPGVRSSALDIAVGGQVWRLRGHPTAEFLDARRSTQPPLLGLTVILVWEVFFGALFVLTRWSRNRSREEHALTHQTVHRLSSALEQTADVVFITDKGGTIEYVNPAFEKVLGYSRQEALGANPRILKSGVHGKDYYESLWRTVLAGKAFRASTVNKKKNGELIHVEQTITPMLDDGGEMTHFVSVLKDMTEERKTQEQEAELRIAAGVQKRLYPARAPRVKGLDIYGAVFSAEATCGDYFDYIPCADGGLAIAIGDVSGHGLGPALLMAETRAYLRPLVNSHEDLGSAFTGLLQNISDDLASDRFITLLAAKISPGAKDLCYASAGHNPGYVMSSDGAIKREMAPTGPALGIVSDFAYATSPAVALEPGDLVLFLTDGVTESRAPDGSFFDDEGALEVVRAHRREPAKVIVNRLREAARAFAGEKSQADDITIVVAKVTPA